MSATSTASKVHCAHCNGWGRYHGGSGQTCNWCWGTGYKPVGIEARAIREYRRVRGIR